MEALKLGDMLISVVWKAGSDPDATVRGDQLARGVLWSDHGDGTIDIAVKERILRCHKPKEPVLIGDSELTETERQWVPEARRHLFRSLNAACFKLPGAEPFAAFLRASAPGILTTGTERLVVQSEDLHGTSWDVLLDGELIGTYTLFADSGMRSWFGRIPGVRNLSAVQANRVLAAIGEKPMADDSHNVVWEDYAGSGTVMPLNVES